MPPEKSGTLKINHRVDVVMTKNKVVIRPADLSVDQGVLCDVLSRHLNPAADRRRFDWLYRNNPHGQAHAWIAVDVGHGWAIGSAAAFPRRLYVNGKDKVGWVLGDFCIAEQYRSLGPALQLQRACLQGVNTSSVSMWYDFPSTSMLAVYSRLGINQSARLIRFARTVRSERKIKEMLRLPVLSDLIEVGYSLCSTFTDCGVKDKRVLTISNHKGHCGEEFSTLARDVGSRYGTCVQRSAEYLNWRYVTNPLSRYELITARVDGRLAGFAAFTHSGASATLVDLFGIDDVSVINSLVNVTVNLLRKRGVVTLNAPLLALHPWVPMLKHMGFVAREAKPVILYSRPLAAPCGKKSPTDRWHLMEGDRDS